MDERDETYKYVTSVLHYLAAVGWYGVMWSGAMWGDVLYCDMLSHVT
jgi:hypothetical protein